jgi:hypothetical protein
MCTRRTSRIPKSGTDFFSRFTVGCKSTVVFDVKSQEIVKLTNQHTPALPIMEEIARYVSFGCQVLSGVGTICPLTGGSPKISPRF